MIRLENLTKNYGKTEALKNVCLEIGEGEAVALLGPNGAGKSTLIKCLLGLLEFSGNISVNNVDVRADSKSAKSFMAYVPQEASFYDMRTIDVLDFYQSVRKTGKERIEQVLEIVGLKQHRFKSTTELSGGMKQRLSFAVALISDCPVLVLDEPTSNLDKESRADLLELTKSLKDSGKTIVFSSHRLDEVYYISDRVIFLDSGKLVKDCHMEDLAAELDYKVRLNIYLKDGQFEKARGLLSQNGYVIEDSGQNFISLRINSNMKIEPIRELIDNHILITDFIVEGQNLEVH